MAFEPVDAAFDGVALLVGLGVERGRAFTAVALDSAVAGLVVFSGMVALIPRSPWRAFYRQANEATVVIAAVGPEAQHDAKRFRRACRNAAARLAEREE